MKSRIKHWTKALLLIGVLYPAWGHAMDSNNSEQNLAENDKKEESVHTQIAKGAALLSIHRLVKFPAFAAEFAFFPAGFQAGLTGYALVGLFDKNDTENGSVKSVAKKIGVASVFALISHLLTGLDRILLRNIWRMQGHIAGSSGHSFCSTIGTYMLGAVMGAVLTHFVYKKLSSKKKA